MFYRTLQLFLKHFFEHIYLENYERAVSIHVGMSIDNLVSEESNDSSLCGYGQIVGNGDFTGVYCTHAVIGQAVLLRVHTASFIFGCELEVTGMLAGISL